MQFFRHAVASIAVVASVSGCSMPSLALTSSAAAANGQSTISRLTSAQCPCIYVPNGSENTVTIYAAIEKGNKKPIATISGAKTGISDPVAVGVDSAGYIYVANVGGTASITVYAPAATGNASPVRSISGYYTKLAPPSGVAIGRDTGDLYVSNVNGHVLIFAPNANGDVAPVGIIAGSNTGLESPVSVALDPSENVYVLDQGPPAAIYVFAAGSQGNVAPVRTISGYYTMLCCVSTQLALDSTGDVYVSEASLGRDAVLVFSSGADGDVPPAAMIEGKKTKLGAVEGVSLDSSNNVYTADIHPAGYPSLVAFPAGATGNVRPIHVISGLKTRLGQVGEITVH